MATGRDNISLNTDNAMSVLTVAIDVTFRAEIPSCQKMTHYCELHANQYVTYYFEGIRQFEFKPS